MFGVVIVFTVSLLNLKRRDFTWSLMILVFLDVYLIWPSAIPKKDFSKFSFDESGSAPRCSGEHCHLTTRRSGLVLQPFFAMFSQCVRVGSLQLLQIPLTVQKQVFDVKWEIYVDRQTDR